MPALVELVVAGDPDAWAAAGFEVTGSATDVGEVGITLAGTAKGGRIREWRVSDLASTELDGLPTAQAEAERRSLGSAPHRNGVTRIDHVVAFSPDLDRTVGVLRAAGLDLRRIREGPTAAGAQRQAFFRVGEPVLEVIEHPPTTPAAADLDAPARFWGLAFLVEDIEASARFAGDLLGDVRDAIQPGRRIATFRREAGLGLPVALMSPVPD